MTKSFLKFIIYEIDFYFTKVCCVSQLCVCLVVCFIERHEKAAASGNRTAFRV
jgi:hypothetical protein